ncbi:reverse transcriptase domain-containing protein [Tanacetum coccineum]|uniref:Reverse transcriptase domain-containing protein n=1 Tax=Tanacetum coccineum TaxID=301880 RepID=A0ABQ5B696_9ASTR
MVDIPDDIDLVDYDDEDPEEDPEEDHPRKNGEGDKTQANWRCVSDSKRPSMSTNQTEIVLLKSKNKIGEKERELLNHDLENVKRALGNVLKRVSVLESGENATLKKRLAEIETNVEQEVLLGYGSYGDCSESRHLDDMDYRASEKESKNSTSDGRGPSEPVDHLDSYRTSLLEVVIALEGDIIMPPKAMSKARMREVIREQVAASMAEFMEYDTVRACVSVDEARGDCKERDKVKFATATLQGRALTWWNGRIASMGMVGHAASEGGACAGNEYSRKGQKESPTNNKQIQAQDGKKAPSQVEVLKTVSPVVNTCMRTRSQARRLRQHQRQQQQVPPNLVEPPKDTMADNRTMAELLQAPTEGYEDAIVVPEIEAANFEIKHGLLTLVQNKQFFGHDKEDPHAHIRYFNKITSTLRYPNVPTTSIKLMLFPFSLEGAARIWLEKEPPRSIQTWDDLVAKFINQFFPPSKTTNLRNEITNFKQRFDESFSEAWDRFKDLLRACPHHGFSELHQLDTFYNALNVNDQDSLNSAAGGNFLDKRPADCSSIIESKSKVRNSRSKAIVAKVSTSASTSGVSPDVAELKDMVRALLLDKQTSPVPAPAPVKAVEQSCVTCGGAHSYRNCPATDSNNYRDNIQEYVSQAAVANFNQGNSGYRPPPMANQIRLPVRVSLPSNTIVNPKGDVKAITTRSGVSYNEPQTSSPPKEKENEPEVTKDTVQPSTENIQPPVVQINDQIGEPVVASKTKPTLPYLLGIIHSSIIDLMRQRKAFEHKDNVMELTNNTRFIDNCSAAIPKDHFPKIRDPDTVDIESVIDDAGMENDKLPVIIAKDLSIGEKAALIKVLQSHKRAIAWKLSDIKGINPEFCTHKILMEEDYTPAVQHQRRVNPKIHDVIKKEVEKLLNTGLIYPISDSPW